MTQQVKTHLSAQELEGFRHMLQDKRQVILGELRDLQHEADTENQVDNQGGGLSTVPTHPADVASEEQQRDITLRLQERQRNLLIDVEEALRRIDDGTYGICLGTGQPIELKRLRAKPWAKFSIEYARQQHED